MRSEQSQKISRFRRKLELERARKQDIILKQVAESLTEKVDALTETIGKVQSPDIDLTEVTEAIKAISLNPEIKFSPNIQVEAPVVNVEVPQDVYAKYKRVNSMTDPEGTYHGFTDANGNWFIQRETTLPNEQATSRYTTGNGQFGKSWPRRKTLSYKPFNEVDIP